ncbi:hypothetical protein [Sphingomonas echinoides]|uniref:MobA/MobL protein domain-containing protein n=1 Tax=Sphingomonas echinoides TaxID=59803 RepID=A0ABU4PHM1_9SPHN|nr:hypothetical protein [Sphingomonas echinoides]MDX5983690.1 hypothetical protein [Sphingomonas echinoides]
MHRYIDALVGDDFGRQSKLTTYSANGFARKKLDTASQSLQLRSERQEKQLRRIEIREWRAAERSVAADLRESDHRIRLMWRSLRTGVRPEKKVRHSPPRDRKRHWPYSAVALPKYDGPVIDRRGERGVFLRIRYYSRRTAEAGVSQRVVKYCYNGAAIDPDGNPYVATNVGLTIDEALCGFDHLEQVNWASQKNAKLLMHGILAVDHRQSPDEMMTCGVRWAEETLGRFDLPYLVTLHAPPPDGDQRNWHLHIVWSFRPLVRTGDHEWQVAEMLRTDLDNPAAMKVFREMFASVMTEMSFEAGQNQVWTAKSNVDRGLPHEPQVHLGGAGTNRARSGERVEQNEENHERVMRSKAAVIDDELRHADEAVAKAQYVARSVIARFARTPTVPMRIPERVVAATMALPVPAFGALPRLSSASIIVPAVIQQGRIEPAKVIGSIVETGRKVPRRSSVTIASATPPQRLARPARLEIANLRIPALPLATMHKLESANLPSAPPRAAIPSLPASPLAGPLRTAQTEHIAIMPPDTARAIVPKLSMVTAVMVSRSIHDIPTGPVPSRSIQPASIGMQVSIGALPILANLDFIDRVIDRANNATRLDDERRQRERDETVRREREISAATDQRQAVDRLLLAIRTERHYLAEKQGLRTVDAALLLRFGLSDDDVAAAHMQDQLEQLAQVQNGELSRIHAYISASPDHLRRDGEHWALDAGAPADIRQLVTAWRNDRTFNAALSRLAGARPGVVAEVAVPEAKDAPGSAWRQARASRDRAMAAWDANERSDGRGMPRPGQQIDRPGVSQNADRSDVVRHRPPLPDRGFGD